MDFDRFFAIGQQLIAIILLTARTQNGTFLPSQSYIIFIITTTTTTISIIIIYIIIIITIIISLIIIVILGHCSIIT
jgi:hypothetical protein